MHIITGFIKASLVAKATWIFGQPDYHRILGRAIVLFSTVGTYKEWHYIDHFSTNKFQHFEGTGRTLWSVLVPSNALKGFPSVPCWRGSFLARKILGFQSTAAIKQQHWLCRILVGVAFVAAGGMWLRCYDADNGGSGERWRRTRWRILRRWTRWDKWAAAVW